MGKWRGRLDRVRAQWGLVPSGESGRENKVDAAAEIEKEIGDLMDAIGLTRDEATAVWNNASGQSGIAAFVRGTNGLRKTRPQTQAEEIAYWDGHSFAMSNEGGLGPDVECVYRDQGLWDAWHRGYEDGRKED